MSGDGFEGLLEALVPGSGDGGATAGEAPGFPTGLGLEPLGVIGRGGVGWVYRAHDPVLGRDVAVKISRPDGGEQARKALLREAQVTSGLEHPAVLPVHRVFAADGLLCVEFRLAPITTLGARLADARGRDEGWPLSIRLRQLQRVIGAVAKAHAQGVLHGDLHPGNVAIGASGEPYVMDWGGAVHSPGRFSGSAAHASPEQLHGAAPGAGDDVYALGVLAWELTLLRPMRPRRSGEGLGDYIARWRDAAVVQPGDLAEVDPALDALICDALAPDPSRRPTAAALDRRLDDIVTGHAEKARRRQMAMATLDESRVGLDQLKALDARIASEQQVATVLRAKIPRHAPVAQKHPLWQAEDRVRALLLEADEVWTHAAEQATVAATLAPGDPGAAAHRADVWWERLRRAEAGEEPHMATLSVRRVRAYDTGKYQRLLSTPSTLSMRTDTPNAVAHIARCEPAGRRLSEIPVADHALPMDAIALSPGSWVVTVEAPGYAPVRVPVLLGRLDHHQADVRMYTPEQVGQGWVQVPGGTFRMGGDRAARQPLDPCTPYVADRFIQRTCVTSADWLAYLDAIGLEEARERAPGEWGLFGGYRGFWSHDGSRWTLPDGWDPQWPAFAVSLGDAEAYAAWLSGREGREIRLPTEEEWEKAARGVDGRSYPWGDGFDPTFTHMRQSTSGAPRPAPVAQYPVDRSVYGALDLAGGMREWTSSLFDVGQMVIRGGTWGDDADDCRCACRAGLQPDFRYSYVSFRLITEHPRPV